MGAKGPLSKAEHKALQKQDRKDRLAMLELEAAMHSLKSTVNLVRRRGGSC